MEDRFQEFWEAWPDNGVAPFTEYTRKKNRPGCEKKWKQKKLDSQAAEIIYDVKQRKKFDKQWKDNGGAFLQGPLPYLNQENWTSGFADLRNARKDTSPNSGAVDLNRVVDWIKENKRLTEKQLTSPWKWIWTGWTRAAPPSCPPWSRCATW